MNIKSFNLNVAILDQNIKLQLQSFYVHIQYMLIYSLDDLGDNLQCQYLR